MATGLYPRIRQRNDQAWNPHNARFIASDARRYSDEALSGKASGEWWSLSSVRNAPGLRRA